MCEHGMVWLSKKNFFVLLSLVAGATVILGAARVAGIIGTDTSSSDVVTSDSEWKSTLSIIPEATAPTRVMKGGIQAEDPSLQATTTTDILARRLVVEYALSQKNATSPEMSDAEATRIANTLARDVKLPQKKEYSQSDINISSDNSKEATALYAKLLVPLIKKQAVSKQQENELVIVTTAMNTQDPASLGKLRTKIDIYQEIIKNLLALKTPSKVAEIHLRLVQSYEALCSATVGFQSILTDPAAGVVALAEYRSGVEGLILVAEEYGEFFAR